METSKTDTSYFCPVTNLPVTVNPEWRNRQFGKDYHVNYYLVGKSILHNAPTGTVNLLETKKGVEYTREVIRQTVGRGKPIVMIYDLIDLKSVTLEARRYFLNAFLRSKNIHALVFCNASPLLRIGIKIGQRFNTSQRPVYIADNYAKAIVMARNICVDQQIEIGPYPLGKDIAYASECKALAPIKLLTNDAWCVQSGGYANKTLVIDDNVIKSTSHGYLQPEDIVLIERMRGLVHNALSGEAQLDFFIVDARDLSGGHRRARKRYIQSIVDWHAKHPIRMYIVIGANAFMRAATILAKPILNFRIEFAQDLNEAFTLIRKAKQQRWLPALKTDPRNTPLKVSQQDVDDLSAYIAGVNWEKEGMDGDLKMNPDHPLNGIAQAIRLVKSELDDLFAERRLAETALKKTQEKYRELFEKGSDWLCIHDLHGNLIETNFAFKTEADWMKNIPIQPNLKDVIPKRYWRGIDDYLGRIQRKGHDQGLLAINVGHGPDIILSYNNVLISDAQGQLTLVKGSARDVTNEVKARKEKKMLQKKLLQSQKMESIGTLAGGIAHDFNNILSSILGFTELAIDEIPPDLKIDVSLLEDNLLEVRRAGLRAKDLVTQILTFARQSDEQVQPIQVSLVAKEVLKLIRSTIPASIGICKSLNSESWVMANSTQIHQIFMNLFANAAQAMDEQDGLLSVDIEDADLSNRDVRSLSDLRPGNHLKITVSDNGVGISKDNIDQIFEPYYTTKSTGSGTGLGLSMVHGIVKGYGGDITVTSKVGSGTAFTIYLPIVPRPSSGDGQGDELLPTGDERVLFVDDEESIVKMVARILRTLGYKETSTSDSRLALELFRDNPHDFDLVITDLSMPQLSGSALAAEMMNIRPDIPIVLVTGYSDKMSAEGAAQLGFKALKLKPIGKVNLAHTIREVLDANVQCQNPNVEIDSFKC